MQLCANGLSRVKCKTTLAAIKLLSSCMIAGSHKAVIVFSLKSCQVLVEYSPSNLPNAGVSNI